MSFSFNEITEPEHKTLIVDALNLAFRWKHQGRSDFLEDYIATVLSFAKSYKCNKIIIAADQGSSWYRKAILPSYKQNRKDKYAEQSEEEAQAFKDFFTEYERCLNVLSNLHTLIRFEQTEADDIAAYLVKEREKLNLGDIVLISSDRDWDLLITEGVMRFSYVTRKEVTVDNWQDHYDVSINQYACFKCLTGDKGDNIPGYTGVGPKRATALLNEFGSAYNIYDILPLPGQGKYFEQINNDPEKILKNYELMDLLTYCEEAIGSENCLEINRRLS